MDISRLLAQKVKVAALLFLAMAFIVLYSLRVDRKAQHMDQAVTSVYLDRLQTALIIVYLSENLHDKRRLLDNHLSGHSGTSATELQAQLADHNGRNDQLVADFEQTVLTRNEAAVLQEFKANLAANARVEDAVLRWIAEENRETATALYNKDGVAFFRQSIESLHILALIQSETGQEIMRGAHRDAAGVSAITSLMIAVAIFIGLLIQSLVQKARFRDGKPSRFDFN